MTKKKKKYARRKRGKEPIPNHVRDWRLFRGFASQVALAEATTLRSQTISRLESFSLGFGWLALSKLAKALDTEPGFLISLTPEEAAVIQNYRKKTKRGRQSFDQRPRP